MMRTRWLLLSILASTFARSSLQGQKARHVAAPALRADGQSGGPLAGLDSYIRRALGDWKVAGLAVAIVKDDALVYARGFGVRDVRTKAPVDERTLFAIGSMTKLFTAVAAGMMVDSGAMAWDEPLRLHLPGFATADPYATEHLSLRDALSHRTGLDWRLDFLWYGSGLTEAEVLRRVSQFAPEPGFRTGYGYSNVMFGAVGTAIGNAAGTTWDAVIHERIFVPLGMSASVTGTRDLPVNGNVASPHLNFAGEPQVTERYDIANIRGAGAINSNVVDLATWLRFLLARGAHEGRQLISETALSEIFSPQSITSPPDESLRRYVNFSLYGFGTELMDYKGRKVVHHAGVIDGMQSYFALIPAAHLGMVVLTNTTGQAGLPPALPQAVTYRVLDVYLGGPSPDWSARFLAERRATLAARAQAQARQESTRVPGTHPTLTLAKYVGQYSGPIGTATVTDEGAVLKLHVGPIASQLEHWNHDTFRFKWDPIGYLFAGFTVDTTGVSSALHVDFVGDFRRVLALPATRRPFE
ncbi:MAG: serine hydrolase [Gemmatimonadaceae bacterium]